MKIRRNAGVFLGFIIMGFVDVVGIATNFAKLDFGLRDQVANVLPLMVFIWFGLFSLPTGLLMNRIGRRKTVLVGLVVSLVSLLLPFLVYQFGILLCCFAGIGIGNMMLQVALNPLLSNVIAPDRITRALTGGQLLKSIASFMGPVLVGLASSRWGNWRFIFPIFSFITLINLLWLGSMKICEGQRTVTHSSWRSIINLLRDPLVTVFFIGVICIVGIDVGMNTTIPRLLMEKCQIPLEKAGLGTSLYFFSRTAGSLLGIFLLAGDRTSSVFMGSVFLGILGITGLIFLSHLPALVVCIIVTGLGVSNIFPVIFSAALKQMPGNENEVSGLLIMGVSGGAVILPVMGFMSDAYGQPAAAAILLLAWCYLLVVGLRMRRRRLAV